MVGCQRMVFSASNALSQTVALVAAQYCGYSGTSRMRSQPSAWSRRETLADRRLAVTHRPVDQATSRRIAAAVGQRGGKFGGGRAGDGFQRALVELFVPDRRVILALHLRAPRQDDEIEDRPPEEAVGFDDPPVGQEFLEIAAHRPIVRALRRAEIDQEHADAPVLDGRMIGRPLARTKRILRRRRVHGQALWRR